MLIQAGGGGGGNPTAWVCSTGGAVHGTLMAIIRYGGAAALEELRATAAAGSFSELETMLAAIQHARGVSAEALDGATAAGGSDSGSTSGSRSSGAAAAAGAASQPAAAGLRMVSACCAACGASDAPLMCAGCQGARYCGAECQKRDWRAHKAACTQRQQQQKTAAAGAAAAAGG